VPSVLRNVIKYVDCIYVVKVGVNHGVLLDYLLCFVRVSFVFCYSIFCVLLQYLLCFVIEYPLCFVRESFVFL
jgi:hypothetical protein